MKWLIPAKTFLVGEYIALQGGPGLILTTTPCFGVTLLEGSLQHDFPVNSPAWNYWQAQNFTQYGIQWDDPYQGRGGLGASSAQFLGAFYAANYINKHEHTRDELLAAYFDVAWSGEGVRPSGYDVIAQDMGGCAYIYRDSGVYLSYKWPFADLAYILVHTGQKLATHTHLQAIKMVEKLEELYLGAEVVCDSFVANDSERLLSGVNSYHRSLCKLGLVTQHSLDIIERIQFNNDILAIKGCGALGADIVLLIMEKGKLESTISNLKVQGHMVVATSDSASPVKKSNFI